MPPARCSKASGAGRRGPAPRAAAAVKAPHGHNTVEQAMGWQLQVVVPRPLSIYADGAPRHSPAEMTEVAAAVETLYNDQLKPYGRILRKRLTERAERAGHGDVEVDMKQLRGLCEASPWLSVQVETESEWFAGLRYRAPCFVDVYSAEDPYPAELWSAAETYFASLCEPEMVLPGGRYLCACVLASRGLPFLMGRSLGQICHIVQLAISQKKILGYTNGSIVPYKQSLSMVKERCAQGLRPCRGQEGEASTVSSWGALRDCVRELLSALSPPEHWIPLSSLKRMFQFRFGLQLSETSLGYAKLSELFQDPRLQDLCEVRMQGHGYVLFPARKQGKRISLVDSLAPETGHATEARSSGNGSSANVSGNSSSGNSPPANSSLRRRARWIDQLDDEDLASPRDRPPPGVPDAHRPTLEPAGLSDGDAGGVPVQCLFPPTPSPCFANSWQLPRLLGSKGGSMATTEEKRMLP
mmetsp:Transcript_59397/g.173778  ORF Transcript_59397/g.173778 Transcript_59397/m.173778 type:complete len:469 (-) Transcript_59397:242-1648(-)